MYEVELKFPLADADALRAELAALGATAADALGQRDVYFAHPVRDFAATDEAFRVRVSCERNVVTYKGPLVDDRTKTRREIEIPFEDDRAEDFEAMLRLLGFRDVRAVRKQRTPYHLEWEGRPVEAVVDEVEGLGTFVEVEAVADEAERVAVQESMLRLAERLGLSNPERRSYLVMLLEREAAEITPPGG